jgi:hypothetical protein
VSEAGCKQALAGPRGYLQTLWLASRKGLSLHSYDHITPEDLRVTALMPRAPNICCFESSDFAQKATVLKSPGTLRTLHMAASRQPGGCFASAARSCFLRAAMAASSSAAILLIAHGPGLCIL